MCGPVGSADLTYRVATRTVSPHLPVTLSYITAASFTNYKHIWIGARSTPLYNGSAVGPDMVVSKIV